MTSNMNRLVNPRDRIEALRRDIAFRRGPGVTERVCVYCGKYVPRAKLATRSYVCPAGLLAHREEMEINYECPSCGARFSDTREMEAMLEALERQFEREDVNETN